MEKIVRHGCWQFITPGSLRALSNFLMIPMRFDMVRNSYPCLVFRGGLKDDDSYSVRILVLTTIALNLHYITILI